MPLICLVSNAELNPNTYIVDANTGATAVHYTGHFGKLLALKTLLEVFKVNATIQDFYMLNVAHYAAR